MPPPSYPVIVIPGITASYLWDQYPLPPEIVWSVMTNDFARARLHPDNPAYEAVEPARVAAGQIFEIAYQELVDELRYNLRTAEDDPVPVYPFGYDWRQPLDAIEAALADFVEEVIARTSLMRNYHPGYAAAPKVNLVGHSMGGLIIAGYLDRFGGRRRVHKVTSLAAPFQGSFEAVIKVTTGTANLGTSAPSSREREAARMTPALYHLVPSFQAGIDIADGLPESLFEPGVWQPSILDTIEEYVRLHGLDPRRPKRDMRTQAERLFQAMLAAAGGHRARIAKLRLDAAGLAPADWLCVIGVGATTRVRLTIRSVRNKPEFEFRSSDRQDEWKADDDWRNGGRPPEHRLTGDGTVPFEGAIPPFLPYQGLVCVSPDDYGYWEGDRLTSSLAGFHGILPNMNLLHRLIVRHFTGRPDRHGNTWGRIPPGVVRADWTPPLPGLPSK